MRLFLLFILFPLELFSQTKNYNSGYNFGNLKVGDEYKNYYKTVNNFYGDTSKGLSDKPEIILALNPSPGYFFRKTDDSLYITIKITTLDKPIAKNLQDESLQIIESPEGLKYVNGSYSQNDFFNPEYILYSEKFSTITNWIYGYKNIEDEMSPNGAYYYYLKIKYTDRYGSRQDIFRLLLRIDIQSSKIREVSPIEYRNIKTFLENKKMW